MGIEAKKLQFEVKRDIIKLKLYTFNYKNKFSKSTYYHVLDSLINQGFLLINDAFFFNKLNLNLKS